jgi:hypothetical protein
MTGVKTEYKTIGKKVLIIKSGKTYGVKESLKADNFKWSAKDKYWFKYTNKQANDCYKCKGWMGNSCDYDGEIKKEGEICEECKNDEESWKNSNPFGNDNS